jgi:hypothetical protein
MTSKESLVKVFTALLNLIFAGVEQSIALVAL